LVFFFAECGTSHQSQNDERDEASEHAGTIAERNGRSQRVREKSDVSSQFLNVGM
jgi:hypothetical protein